MIKVPVPRLAGPAGWVCALLCGTSLAACSPDDPRPHEWLERAETPPELAEVLAQTGRRTGLRIPEMESLNPFADVFVKGSGSLVYVTVVADEDGELWQQLRSLESDGWENGPDSPTASMLFGSGDSVLSVWEDLEGTRIAVHDLTEPAGG